MTKDLYRASARALQVVTAKGRRLSAGRASLFVLEKAGWDGLARLLSWPPFIWVVEVGYRIVARYRGRLGRWLLKAEDAE